MLHPKPPKREKKPLVGLQRGGRKPKNAGRRFEAHFSEKYGFRRQVGSGAFGAQNPTLLGDVTGEIGRLSVLFELKSWNKVDGRGQKIVSFPASLLDKISLEAELLGKAPIFLYHVKGSTKEYAVVEYEWLHNLILSQEDEIAALTQQLEECLKDG